jgi:hypothetical protein
MISGHTDEVLRNLGKQKTWGNLPRNIGGMPKIGSCA